MAERLVRAAGLDVAVSLSGPDPGTDSMFERTPGRSPAQRLADATRVARFVLRGRNQLHLFVASLEDVIRSKQAADLDKDRLALPRLRRLLDRLQDRGDREGPRVVAASPSRCSEAPGASALGASTDW